MVVAYLRIKPSTTPIPVTTEAIAITTTAAAVVLVVPSVPAAVIAALWSTAKELADAKATVAPVAILKRNFCNVDIVFSP